MDNQPLDCRDTTPWDDTEAEDQAEQAKERETYYAEAHRDDLNDNIY